jgi:hypothetical protein
MPTVTIQQFGEVPGRPVSPGIVVVSAGLSSGVKPNTATSPAGPSVNTAPVVNAGINTIVRVSVDGLGSSRTLNVAMQTATGWVKLGEAKTNADGRAILPAISSSIATDVVLRIKGPNGKTRYVVVRSS